MDNSHCNRPTHPPEAVAAELRIHTHTRIRILDNTGPLSDPRNTPSSTYLLGSLDEPELEPEPVRVIFVVVVVDPFLPVLEPALGLLGVADRV